MSTVIQRNGEVDINFGGGGGGGDRKIRNFLLKKFHF